MIPRICRTCLCYEGMPFFLEATTIGRDRAARFRVLDDGRCTLCSEYINTRTIRDRERRDLLVALTRRTDMPVVLSLSSAKDSLSTLFFARRVLGLAVHASVYDNGFILPGVIEQLRAICDRLDVPLVVQRTTAAAFAELDASVRRVRLAESPPCDVCSRSFVPELARYAEALDASHVLLGVNHFLTWPSAGSPLGIVGSSAGRFAALPYVFGLTRADTVRYLRELGVAVPAPTEPMTNCRVPGLVQARLGEAVGHVPEIELLSLEILAGHLTREEALASLAGVLDRADTPRIDWMRRAYLMPLPIRHGTARRSAS